MVGQINVFFAQHLYCECGLLLSMNVLLSVLANGLLCVIWALLCLGGSVDGDLDGTDLLPDASKVCTLLLGFISIWWNLSTSHSEINLRRAICSAVCVYLASAQLRQKRQGCACLCCSLKRLYDACSFCSAQRDVAFVFRTLAWLWRMLAHLDKPSSLLVEN